MKRFCIWLIMALVSLAFVNPCSIIRAEEGATETVDFARIINIAGRQRMLTQRMSKEVLLVAWNVDSVKNAESLRKNADAFDRALNGLIGGDKGLGIPPAVNQDIKDQLYNVKALWGDFREIINDTIASKQTSESIIKKVSDMNLSLLNECNTVVMMYEVEAEQLTGGSAIVINLAGKQRMLTQKMAKEFLLITLNVNPYENKLRLKHSAYLFERTLGGLIKGDRYLKLPATTNSSIVSQLASVQKLWDDFKGPINSAVITGKWTQESIRKIADLNLPLLSEMHKAVRMYEEEHYPGLAVERDDWVTY